MSKVAEDSAKKTERKLVVIDNGSLQINCLSFFLCLSKFLRRYRRILLCSFWSSRIEIISSLYSIVFKIDASEMNYTGEKNPIFFSIFFLIVLWVPFFQRKSVLIQPIICVSKCREWQRQSICRSWHLFWLEIEKRQPNESTYTYYTKAE